MSKVKVIGKKAVCPNCESENIMHSYDVSIHGYVRIGEDGVPEAFGHSDMHRDSECSGYRVLCLDCSWTEDECGLDVV